MSNRNQNLSVTEDMAERCRRKGFLLLGGFSPESGDAVPDTAPGRFAGSLFLVGSTGPGVWPAFSESPEFGDGVADPLDRFTRRVLSAVAQDIGVSVLFPFDGPPYHPFQQWAIRSGGFSQSPLGVLVHDIYGPWIGFRAAFLSADDLGTIAERTSAGPCPTCTDRPCLAACPVNAISESEGYDVPRCRDHLAGGQGGNCFSGCLARHACPFGSAFRQRPDNARFHMDSFMGLSEA